MNYGLPDPKPKKYERQEGETNLWFDRFVKFCLYGSARSLDQCFRDVVGDYRAAQGRARPREDARAPGAWRKQAKLFSWWARAEAWDAEQRILAMNRVADTLDLVRNNAQKAAQFQIDLMNNKIEGADVIQRRLASNSLMNRAGVVHDGLQGDEEDGAAQVIGIRINRGVGSGEGGAG